MSQAGNVEAIRDWANSYFYNNDQIADFFIKASDSNLKAYKVTLIGYSNTSYTIVEDTQTNPQTYTVKTGPDGIAISLMFFHNNPTVNIGANSYTFTSYTPLIVASSDQYLLYSYVNKIIASIDSQNYNWETGNTPLELSANCAYDSSEQARSVPVRTNSVIAKVDLGATTSPFTAYIVAKAPNCSAHNRLLSSSAFRSAGHSIMLYGNPVTVSTWGDTPGKTLIDSHSYFAAAIRFTESGDSAGLIAPSTKINKVSTDHGRYLVLGATDENFANPTNLEPTDLFVKYIGVVNESESDSIVFNNLMALKAAFNVSQ